ncbi:hypothetical protein WH52_09360 [Tenacibaculum holothuriorum]|uniref:Peptidyl-prolyl cis-trans isomerase n=1 Tax=Tenacibaculum holothuriorum TaxID=1635173 RepID=A0A1Y2PCA1_9FLAO|nr:gliding motility-associated peptidyl-prolyl isomerase GldI [Tenacibaculum holothuriorum]OSY87641.1 hypothetical protein WH52_09360 [Tenacibaculum holothuriorum]
MKNSFIILLLITLMVSCATPEARRPKQHGTTNFYKEVLAKNKRLNALEKKAIESWIKKDTLYEFKPSTSGFWYAYQKKDTVNVKTPKPEEVTVIDFDITDLYGNVIYPKQQKEYTVDKQDFISGLQDGIKLMKKGETITFVIPSYRAYGVVGDGNKIKGNQPIKSTITLIDIKSKTINENN